MIDRVNALGSSARPPSAILIGASTWGRNLLTKGRGVEGIGWWTTIGRRTRCTTLRYQAYRQVITQYRQVISSSMTNNGEENELVRSWS